MQLDIDPKTFLEALLGSDLETAHVLVLDAYRAATKALLADRDRYFSVLQTIDPETFSTVTGRTKTEFKPVYHTAPLEPTGRTSTEQQLTDNLPSVPPEHAGRTLEDALAEQLKNAFETVRSELEECKMSAATKEIAERKYAASAKPTPETWHQVRSIHQARMFVGQTVAVSYEPPSPHDDGDTHVHTYVADIIDQGRGCWSLVDTRGGVVTSGGPCDEMAVVYLRPWGKGYGWTDADVCGIDSRERGPLRACKFDVSLDDYDEGTEMPVQVGLTHGWAIRERVYTGLEAALEATRAADVCEESADEEKPEWKGWARLYTIEQAREWIGRKAHVSVGPPNLADLAKVYEISDVKPFSWKKDGWELYDKDGNDISHGCPTDEEPYVLHLLEVSDEPKTPTLDEVNAGAVRAARRVQDWPEWKRQLSSPKPKPGMWHKVTTQEEAERFVGMRVARVYRQEQPTDHPSSWHAIQPYETVHCVSKRASGSWAAWTMHDSKGNAICVGCDPHEPLDTYVWVVE